MTTWKDTPWASKGVKSKDKQVAVLHSFLPPLHLFSLPVSPLEFQLRGFKVSGSVDEGVIKQAGCFSVTGLWGLSRPTAELGWSAAPWSYLKLTQRFFLLSSFLYYYWLFCQLHKRRINGKTLRGIIFLYLLTTHQANCTYSDSTICLHYNIFLWCHAVTFLFRICFWHVLFGEQFTDDCGLGLGFVKPHKWSSDSRTAWFCHMHKNMHFSNRNLLLVSLLQMLQYERPWHVGGWLGHYVL